jgi:hypothetical protein
MFVLLLEKIILTLPKKRGRIQLFLQLINFFLYRSKSNLNFSSGKEKENILTPMEVLTKETGKMV